jgi:hypothetical protein
MFNLIHIVSYCCAAGCIVLCGDVQLNPRPNAANVFYDSAKNVQICPLCRKNINAGVAHLPCKLCKNNFHLKCLGVDFDFSGSCHLCSSGRLSEDDFNEDDLDLPLKLQDIMNNRGLKILHQNIQSLPPKIDQLRLLLFKLKSSIHLFGLTETWTKHYITNQEINIPGYKLFRKDRKGKGGGVAFYARNDVIVNRRDDLECSDVEGLWLEVSLPKSRSFLVGVFYRPPNSSNHYDKDFCSKLDRILNTATSKGQEVIVLGDWNTDFFYQNEPLSLIVNNLKHYSDHCNLFNLSVNRQE